MGWGSSFSKAFSRIGTQILDETSTIWEQSLAGTERIGRQITMQQGGLKIPDLLEEDEDSPLVDEEAARLLAQKRRSLNAARIGRSSLRIDLPNRNPGISAGLGSGLRIP